MGDKVYSYDALCDGLIREYLSRKGCTEAIVAFDKARPRDGGGITTRRELAQALHLEKLVRLNKERGDPYNTYLELIVDYLNLRAHHTRKEKPNNDTNNDNDNDNNNGTARREKKPVAGGADTDLTHEKENWTRSIPARRTTPLPITAQPNIRTTRDTKALINTLVSFDSTETNVEGFAEDDIVSRHARLHASVASNPQPLTSRKYEIRGTRDARETRDLPVPSAPLPPSPTIETPKPVIQTNFITPPPPQAIGSEQAKALDVLVFGGKGIFQKEWHQGFFFSDKPELRYGLIQLRGGPCGVIAVVQAFLIKELVFSPNFVKSGFNPSDHARTTALINSLSEILWQAGESKSAKVVIPTTHPKKFKAYKLSEFIVHSFNNFDDMKQCIAKYQGLFMEREGLGVVALVYSAVLTRGISEVEKEMDTPTNTLLAPHKYSSQELVNLLLVGKASSNVFDETMTVGGATLKGIFKRSSIGFLTLMEKLGYCQVGNNLKSPLYPIYILYGESHYSLLFGTERSPSPPSFDLYYYDEMGNQDEQYRITLDISSEEIRKFDDTDLVPPIELCVCTKWTTAVCNWNGNEPLL